MAFLARLYFSVKAIVVILFLCMTLAPIVPIMCLVWVIVRPFSRVVYLKFASFLQMSWLSVEVFTFEILSNVKLRITGDVPTPEPALCISNHITHDYVMIYSLAYRTGTLADTRAIIKNSIKYTPFLGPAVYMCYWPFISRNFQKDIRTLKSLFKLYREADMPAQIWIFPEGTRLAEDKLKSSQEYAAKKGYPVWNNVMLPKYRGFSTALDSMKETFHRINDVTIQFEGWPDERIPGLWDIFAADTRVPHTLHIHIKRHNIADVPENDEGRQKWLMDRFEEKEALINDYKKNNRRFPGKELSMNIVLSQIIVHPLVWGIGSFAACFASWYYYPYQF